MDGLISMGKVEPLQPRGDGKVVVIKEETRCGSGDKNSVQEDGKGMIRDDH